MSEWVNEVMGEAVNHWSREVRNEAKSEVVNEVIVKWEKDGSREGGLRIY